MDAQPDSTQVPTDVSLVRGGPFHRLQQALGLLGPNRWNLTRRIIFFIAISWLPLFLLTVLFHPEGLLPLMRDYRVYSRLLLAIPALLVGEPLMEGRFRTVIGHIRRAGLLDSSELVRVDTIIARLVRVGDYVLPELVVLLLLITHSLTSYRGLIDTSPWLSHRSGGELYLTAAGWYAVVISSSIFQFLLGLALWRWLLWGFLAFKLSKSDLNLVATHPDQHGGLGFLGLTSAAFAPIAFSATAVVASTWRNDILHHGAHLMDFKLQGIALILLIAVIALGPLAFFIPRLAALRRQGILEYGILGQIQSKEFHDKWISRRAGLEPEFLTAPESSTLADYGNACERINDMSPLLVDKGSLYTLAAAIAIPALPMVLAQIPLAVVLSDLLKALR